MKFSQICYQVKNSTLEWSIQMILIMASVYFINEMVDEYLKENTSFSVTKQTITKEDLPTVTICLMTETEMTYGEDFIIQVMNSSIPPWDQDSANVAMITLQDGINEYDFIAGKREITLKLLEVAQLVPRFHRNCLTMKFRLRENPIITRPTVDEGAIVDLAFITITLSSERSNETIHKATLYVTSEINSYGIVLNGWYDGKAKPHELYKGGLLNIQIPKLKRFEYLKKTCTPSSFYECLGEQFKTHSMFQVNSTPCTPLSFPSNVLNICPRNVTKELIKSISFKDNLMYTMMEKCMGQKPCITEEYSLFENVQWSGKDQSTTKRILKDYIFNKTLLDELLEGQSNKLMILMEFAKGKWSNGLYANKIQKHIHKEYLAWTATSMVGNVGGLLGLWVGFSFTGFILGAIKFVTRVSNIVR